MFTENEIREQALAKMQEWGIAPRNMKDRMLKLDGKWQRYDIEGQKRGSKNGAYKIFTDFKPAGYFQDWSNPSARYTWSFDSGGERVEFDAEQWEKERKRRQEEELKKQLEAAERARIRFESTPSVAEHQYLRQKGILAHGVHVDDDGRLLIPLCDVNMRITSLQWISPDGKKQNFSGGRMSGSFFPFAIEKLSAESSTLLIGEGFATMAKIHELTERPCVAAMSSGNLDSVVEAFLRKVPYVKIILMADNDIATFEKRGFNPGLDSARAVMSKYPKNVVAVLYPHFSDSSHGSDWVDFANSFGDDSEGIKKMCRDVYYFSLSTDERKEFEAVENLKTLSNPLYLSTELPTLEFIGGLFPRGYLSAIVAPPGAGKTMFMQKFVSDLSVGGSILDSFHENEPIRKSLIFAAEAGFDMLLRRASSLKWVLCPERVIVIDQYTLELNGCPVMLDDSEGLANVRRLVEIHRPDIIFFDTLMNFHEGDENLGKEMKPVFVALLQLARQFDVAIVLIHHTRKRTAKERLQELDQDDAVGSGIFSRYMAVLVGLEPSREESDVVKVSALKSWFKKFTPFRYRISEEKSGGVFEIFSCDDSDALASVVSSKDTIWDYLRATFPPNEWFCFDDIDVDVLGLSVVQLRKALAALSKNGKLKKRGNTKNTEYSVVGFYG